MKFRILNSEFRIRGQANTRRLARALAFLSLLVTCHSSLATSLHAATHVTASYDLGPNPRVMTTVGATSQYGLVFAQRNKAVTYGGVQYGTAQIKGYLDATGQLNDGSGNLWLDLVPNTAAVPGDSFYVVTLNIQGQVHSEIWVVPDQPTVGAQLCRQAQPPSSSAPVPFYQLIQHEGAELLQRPKLNFTGSGVACSDNPPQQRTDCAISGGSGAAVSPATADAAGIVKTESTSADPVVYLKTTADSLLAGKANSAHAHAEADVSGLAADLASKAPLAHGHAESEVTGLVTDLAAKAPAVHSHAETEVANLTSDLAGKAPLSHSHPESEILNLTSDLSSKAPATRSLATAAPLLGGGDLSADRTFSIDLFGTAPGAKVVSTSLTGDPTTDNCVKWLAGGKLGDAAAPCGSGGSAHAFLSPTHSDTLASTPVLGGILAANSTPAWQQVAGNTSTTTRFLSQAGNGSLSALPVWATLSSADLPSHPHAESDVTNLVTDLDNRVPTTRNVGTSSPLGGGGSLSADLTLTCATCEVNGNKNAANGYAGLDASTKLNAAEGQEVWSVTDLTDYGSTSGTGSTAIRATITSPAANDVLAWSGTNWINQAPAGGGGDNISVNSVAATDADFDDATPAAPANSLNVKWQKDAQSPNNISAYLPYTAPLTVTAGSLDCQNATSSQKGCLTAGDWGAFNGKADLVASGTAGAGPSKPGAASTAARSDHDHRSIHLLTWYFPGTPPTGIQNMVLVLPDAIVNPAILDLRVTVNTTSASSSTFNVQRCTANCTGSSPTFADIYSAVLTLGANTRAAAKGAAPNQNVSGLAAGDQFKASLVTLGSGLADVTLAMTVKYETTN